MAALDQGNIIKVVLLLICCAFGLSLGMILLILGCALWNNWWALFAICLYLFAPIPDLLAKILSGVRGSSIDELFVDKPSVSLGEHMGAFFTAVLATLAIGLICILLHANVIPWQTFLFQLAGGLIIGVTIVGGLAAHRVLMFRNKSTEI
eukprot:CAMPEP_0117449024 /NCGR_PEP_ID=MMETSP0759-20121206/7718_1 /TAXON_ID=63605 /ORGANISM="Percolomonas cosmopolitus, Strain WS" /LENGTH=149 /DNA_ID=CAMNT_0005241459 /DNA_START=73 /DNA_END=522 /DNA_ORIENTATION=+